MARGAVLSRLLRPARVREKRDGPADQDSGQGDRTDIREGEANQE